GRAGQARRALALVEPVAPHARGAAGLAARLAAAGAGRLVGVRQRRGDRGGVGGAAPLGGAWDPVWRCGLAAADRRTSGPAIHLPPPRPAAQPPPAGAGVTKAPDPFFWTPLDSGRLRCA